MKISTTAGSPRPEARRADAPAPPVEQPPLPDTFNAGTHTYVKARDEARMEPDHLKGVVYQQSGDKVTVLKYSGETTDTLPPDIPASAVKNNRVVIYVDGIHQEWPEQKRQISCLLQGQAPSGADVGQDVIGIHEGAGKNGFRDGLRIAKVLGMLKLVQNGLIPLQWATKKIFTIDPAIKSVHDEVKQSLLAGRKVQLMTHSGGGAETATALTLLAKEGMRQEISDNVRLLSLSSAAAPKDFLKAGIKADNLYYTGSKKDPVYYMFRHFIGPLAPLSTIGFGLDVARYALSFLHKDPNELAYHAPDFIFAQNVDSQGQRIQKFLDGGPGGHHPL